MAPAKLWLQGDNIEDDLPGEDSRPLALSDGEMSPAITSNIVSHVFHTWTVSDIS